MEPIFEGTGVALVLPMFEDGSIDYEGYKRQVQRMIDGGVKALLVNGTTGAGLFLHLAVSLFHYLMNKKEYKHYQYT